MTHPNAKEHYKKWYLKNRDKKLKQSEEYRRTHQEYCKTYRENYYIENKQDLLIYAKNYRDRNQDKIKEYWQSNRGSEIARQKTQRRRTLKKGLKSTLTINEWRDILKYFDNCCAYCLKNEKEIGKLTQDHIVPLSKGGGYTRDNIVPACKSCNSSKGNKSLLIWMAK